MSLEYIKRRVSELQNRLGCELQVTIYNSTLNDSDELIQAAKDCRMSIVTEGSEEWSPGSKLSSPIYAVHIVAEGIGEIPYALMTEETYLEGKDSHLHEADL